MAEHPIIMDSKQVKVLVRQPGQKAPPKDPVVDKAPNVSEPKKTIGQRVSKYAFGEEVEKPMEYIYTSYLEPTGKRVANDIVEYFLLLIKHTFQRWIWHGKVLDDGKWGRMDRESFSNISRRNEPVRASQMMSPVKELTFDTQKDAENVLKELQYTIKEENMVTVRQYYEASGVPELVESNGVSSSSGWKNLEKASVEPQPDGNGYYIKLPRPINLSSASN